MPFEPFVHRPLPGHLLPLAATVKPFSISAFHAGVPETLLLFMLRHLEAPRETRCEAAPKPR